jgi:hypothetical protein
MIAIGLIDFDKLLRVILSDLAKVQSDWYNGGTGREVAFMGDFIRIFSKGRRNCDVGSIAPLTCKKTLYFLDQKGIGGSDAYGVEIGITLRIHEIPFSKTPIFQL